MQLWSSTSRWSAAGSKAMSRANSPTGSGKFSASPQDGSANMSDTWNSASPNGVVPTTAEALARLDMPLLDAMMTQRALRRVLPDPVDDEIVLKCIELALRAPTGSNGQNWEFLVVKDREKIAQFGRRNRQAWRIYGGIGRRLAKGEDAMNRILDAVQWQADHFEEIPVLVVP